MARTLEATPQLRIMFALHKARQYRHHRDCHCRMYQKQACNKHDLLWTTAMNEELDQIMAGH